jgi:hypothetical protein
MLFIGFLLPSTANASVKVHVDVEPHTGSVEDIFSLIVTVSGKATDDISEPAFESSDKFELMSVGTSRRISIINGAQQSELSFTFHLTPKTNIEPGTYKTPKGNITIDNRSIPIKQSEIVITSRQASSGSNRGESSDGIQFFQKISESTPYIGQQILYEAVIVTNRQLYEAQFIESDFAGFWYESLGKPEETRRAHGNQIANIYTSKRALFPTQTGVLTIPVRELIAGIPVRQQRHSRQLDRFSGVWGSFFDFDLYPSVNIVKRRFLADEIKLNVLPIPEPPFEYSGQILVGNVQVAASIDKEEVKQGESITMTIELYGDANLRPYELPPISEEDSKNFRVYEDAPSLESFEEKYKILYKKRFSFALIPQVSGELRLPTFIIPVFDPHLEQFYKRTTSDRTINVIEEPSIQSQHVRATTRDEQSEEIVVRGEDILPQHIGRYTFRYVYEISNSAFFIILSSLLLFSLVMYWYARYQQKLRSDPSLVAELQAFQHAVNSLEQIEMEFARTGPSVEYVERIHDAFTKYINARCSSPALSFTPVEACRLVKDKTGDVAIAEKVEKLLIMLERNRFSGKSIPLDPSSINNLLREVKDLVQKLEKIK